MNLYWFDIFVFGFTFLLGLKGIVNGLLKEFFGLLGVLGGFILASKYSKQAADFIENTFHRIDNQDLALFLGFLLVLILVWVFCLILGVLLTKLVKLSGLGFLNRLGGFIFGSAKVFLILAILIYYISTVEFLNQNLHKYTQGGYSLPILTQVGAFIVNDPTVKSSVNSVIQNSFDTNNTEENLTQGE
ncbi:colicin V synthesis protein [Campylobacter sp. MIT 99-7217]|uniref:CvpA family protein n=1 Tax=Campylobacter sp. MIT 99-7217 TaxID=535091 RepID=UPI0011590DF4|nr:CvpA family protein [Campylobacter sp. MIT 99-7217]TQR33094.1 colicin V synthesis protein [Campylobacter sp. MIT 99-7217]